MALWKLRNGKPLVVLNSLGYVRSTTSYSTKEAIEAKHEARLQKVDPNAKTAAAKLCSENLGHPQLVACAKKLGRKPPTFEGCFTDLLFLDEDCERKQYLQRVFKHYAKSCGIKKLEFNDAGCAKKRKG